MISLIFAVAGTFLALNAKKMEILMGYDCGYDTLLKAEIGFRKKSREESLKPGTVIISGDST